MRPPAAIARRMWISGQVRVLVVYAVGGDPGDRPALERQRAANREKVFERPRDFIGPVRQQAMESHADAETGAKPVQKDRCGEGFPVKHEERGDGAQVEQHHG